MIKRFLPDRTFCGLDLGTQTVKAALLRFPDQNHPELLGVYEMKTNGFEKASVRDLNELTECIQRTLLELSKRAGIKIKEVQLGVGGEIIHKRLSEAIIPLLDRGTKVIGPRDVKRIQNQARILGTEMEEMILHDFPFEYRVDDVNSAVNPVGLLGRKLQVSTMIITANSSLIRNLIKAVNQAGHDVMNVCYSGYTAAQAALNDLTIRKGCALVNLGAATTDVLVYHEGRLRYLEMIPLGGAHISRRIAADLNIVFDLAEDIKKSYGIALGPEMYSEEEILVKREEGYMPVKKELISRAIDPLIDELILAIQAALKESDGFDALNAGIIVLGGGALLAGLPERLERSTNIPVHMGRIVLTSKQLHNSAKFAAAVGLAQQGMQKAFGYRGPSNGGQAAGAGLVSRVKDLFQEYF